MVILGAMMSMQTSKPAAGYAQGDLGTFITSYQKDGRTVQVWMQGEHPTFKGFLVRDDRYNPLNDVHPEIPAHQISPYDTYPNEFLLKRRRLIETELSDAEEKAYYRDIECCKGTSLACTTPYYELRNNIYAFTVGGVTLTLCATGNPIPALLCDIAAIVALPKVRSIVLHKLDPVAIAELTVINATLAKRKEKQD
jgi:hypothetical protein